MNIISIAEVSCSADIEVPSDCIVYEHYQGKQFQKIKASSQQSCGTDNRTERLTSGTHGPDCCIEQRELGRRNENNKSARDTDITALQLENVGQSPKSDAKSKNQHLPRDHLSRFSLIRGSRGPLK
jgi:hypothetical protein